jgi:hypothetical protein
MGILKYNSQYISKLAAQLTTIVPESNPCIQQNHVANIMVTKFNLPTVIDFLLRNKSSTCKFRISSVIRALWLLLLILLISYTE